VTPTQKRVSSGLALATVLISSVLLGRRAFSAPVTDAKGRLEIIEYSDYECPHCKVAQPVLRQLLEKYGSKVTRVHRNFPLEMAHKWARAAAIASVCAERQGKFEAYDAALFDRQDDWSKVDDPTKLFADYAKEFGLDAGKFEDCRKDPAVDAKVSADRDEARALGVQSTPTFFIDGERMIGSQQLAPKAPEIIEKWLGKNK
jgi:protein-disulfide isomerase